MYAQAKQNLQAAKKRLVDIKKLKEFLRPIALLQSLIALFLIGGCLFAAQWQYNRGTSQYAVNAIIKTNLGLLPVKEPDISTLDPITNQWRTLNLIGSFDNSHQELIRNRYFEGKFGFEVLTLFSSVAGDNFWVDRGWVAAGPNAATPPQVTPAPTGEIKIRARIRSENLSRQLQGSFFVTKIISEKPKSIAKIQGVDAKSYYLDLLPNHDKSVLPLTPIALPEISGGPHFAYALQWLAFALLTLIGRALLFRETKRLALK